MTGVIRDLGRGQYAEFMRALFLASVWVHIIAAMTWLGGMIVFVTSVMPFFRGRDEALRAAFFKDFGRRFTRVVWICLVTLLITGTFNAWARGVRLSDPFSSEWRASAFGHLLLVKLTLVAITVGVCGAHERLSGASQRWLGRLTLLLGLAIVFIGILLVRGS
jgi:uncharacterized membrane protein